MGKKSVWTNEELDLLKTCDGMTYKEIMKLFPHKKYDAIVHKCNALKLNTVSNKNRWTDSEVNLLLEIYPTISSTDEILHLFENKTRLQIRQKAKALKVKMKKIDRTLSSYSKNDTLECLVCKKEFSPFSSDAVICTITNCGNERTIVSPNCRKCENTREISGYYRRKYGILLDAKLFYDTYDIIQWYKWTISENTPNGKMLDMIPNNLQTKDNIKTVIRYVINDVLGLDSKEKIKSLSFKTLMKYKISFTAKDYLNSLYRIINFAFPEYELKERDLQNLHNYWNNYDNFMYHVKLHYSNYKHLSNLYGLKYIYSVTFLQKNNSKLHSARVNYYQKTLWKEIIKDAQIDDDGSFDGNTYNGELFDSAEEKNVYIHIKEVLKINIINNRIGKDDCKRFLNNDKNTNYIPDYYFYNNKGKLVVIEYFGLYNEKSKTEMYVKYRERTANKIEYFNNIENISFIPLFPSDLNKNFANVKSKLKKYIIN